MRIEPIIAINPQQNRNEHVLQNLENPHSKTASGLTFRDYLRANIQILNIPAVPAQTESQIAGLLWGYFPQMRNIYRENPEFETNVS